MMTRRSPGPNQVPAPALARLDRALLRLRRFLAAPPTVLDDGRTVELSTLLVLDAVLGVEAAGVLDVARELTVAPSTASRLVDRAVAAGTLEKVRGNHDARRVVLRATVDGVELAGRAQAHRQRALAELLAGWSPRERAELVDSLERLAGTVRDCTSASGAPAPASSGGPAPR